MVLLDKTNLQQLLMETARFSFKTLYNQKCTCSELLSKFNLLFRLWNTNAIPSLPSELYDSLSSFNLKAGFFFSYLFILSHQRGNQQHIDAWWFLVSLNYPFCVFCKSMIFNQSFNKTKNVCESITCVFFCYQHFLLHMSSFFVTKKLKNKF